MLIIPALGSWDRTTGHKFKTSLGCRMSYRSDCPAGWDPALKKMSQEFLKVYSRHFSEENFNYDFSQLSTLGQRHLVWRTCGLVTHVTTTACGVCLRFWVQSPATSPPHTHTQCLNAKLKFSNRNISFSLGLILCFLALGRSVFVSICLYIFHRQMLYESYMDTIVSNSKN